MFLRAAARLLVFVATVVARLLVYKATSEVENVSKNSGKVKYRSGCYSYKIQLFFFNKHSSHCCEPLIDFQSSKKVDFDSFCQDFCCFYGGMECQRLLPCHSRNEVSQMYMLGLPW